MEWIQLLESYWRDHGWLSEPISVDDAAVFAFERKNSVTLPSDVRLYFQRLNGMNTNAGHDLDDNGFRFLPLARVQQVGDFVEKMKWKIDERIVGHRTAFVFIDYLQWCGAYAFETASPGSGRIYLLGYPNPRVVAPSLSRFVELYLSDDFSIYGP